MSGLFQIARAVFTGFEMESACKRRIRMSETCCLFESRETIVKVLLRPVFPIDEILPLSIQLLACHHLVEFGDLLSLVQKLVINGVDASEQLISFHHLV
jgi:hypothetical protein